MTKTDELLIEIARCHNFINPKKTVSENGDRHPCKTIVDLQKVGQHRQLPEPWNGDIENSPILFISSNPSINSYEHYPLDNWKDEEIIDFFKNRFSNERKYVRDYKYPRIITEDTNTIVYAKNWVRNWSWVRRRSGELLERTAIPGKDYTLMEIVRCKSEGEEGVTEAMNQCADNYLKKTLLLTNAKIIIVVGSIAEKKLSEMYSLNFESMTHIEKEIEGHNRIIIVSPHSNARGKRTMTAILNEGSLKAVKDRLKE